MTKQRTSLGTVLLWLVVAVCCAFPFVFIIGGLGVFAGIVFQQGLMITIGGFLVVLSIIYYIRRRREEVEEKGEQMKTKEQHGAAMVCKPKEL